MAGGQRQCVTWWGLWLCVLLGVVEAIHEGAPDLEEGRECSMNDGSDGICRLITRCPYQLARLKMERPKTCSFQQRVPVVCCNESGPQHPSGNLMSSRILQHDDNQTVSPPSVQRHPYDPYNPGGLEVARWLTQRVTPSSVPWRIYWNARPPPTQSPGRIYWNGQPVPLTPPPNHYSTSPPTTSSTSRVTAMQMKTTRGEKSTKACKEYLREIAKLHVWRIFNGRAVQPGKFPHMALLGYLPEGQTKLTWNCGGTLISRRFVLTAAHCFTNKGLKAPVRVRLGEHDLLDDEDHAVDYAIKTWQIHPDYHPRSWYHDLALIQLFRNVVFTQFIQPACLWTHPQDPDKGLIITGWGSTDKEGEGMSNVLLQGSGTLKIVEPKVCTDFYKAASSKLQEGVRDEIMCMLDDIGRVDTCQGDSGGPVQVSSVVDLGEFKATLYQVVAVVSGGSRWCGTKVPSINTRLYHYLDWIESHVWPE